MDSRENATDRRLRCHISHSAGPYPTIARLPSRIRVRAPIRFARERLTLCAETQTDDVRMCRMRGEASSQDADHNAVNTTVNALFLHEKDAFAELSKMAFIGLRGDVQDSIKQHLDYIRRERSSTRESPRGVY
mmetsp:Transcript_4631/g.11923  ORF Transcript_4631/g.11923 Transcript_4631/m.11923 type:complete len:133 (+) Transcript_4631:325-723(+)